MPMSVSTYINAPNIMQLLYIDFSTICKKCSYTVSPWLGNNVSSEMNATNLSLKATGWTKMQHFCAIKEE